MPASGEQMKYVHIKQLRFEVSNLLDELMRVSCETVESIAEWRTERNVLRTLSRRSSRRAKKNNGGSLSTSSGIVLSAPTPTTSTTTTSSPSPAAADPFIWNRQNYMQKMLRDVQFLSPHRMLCVQAMKKFMRQRVSRQQAMQLDSSENNPMENISTTMMLNMTRRTEDFPLFFDKHDTSGDGKLQRKEFMGVLREMGIVLTTKQITELYFVLDRDGDGEIDTKELLRTFFVFFFFKVGLHTLAPQKY